MIQILQKLIAVKAFSICGKLKHSFDEVIIPSSKSIAGGIVLINVKKQPKEVLLDFLNINK